MTFIVDSYSETNKDDQLYLADVYPSTTIQCAAGQTFEVENPCRITSAKFYLHKGGNPTGSLTYKIYRLTGTFGTDGLPTGDPIGESESLDISTLNSAGFTLEELDFTDVYLTAGYYCIAVVIDSEILLDGSNKVAIGYDVDGTHSGNAFKYVNGWSVVTGKDFCFYVYGEYINGKFNETKKALIDTIQICVPEATVEGNWRQSIQHIVRDLPFVTVRMKDVLSDVYDRNIGESSDGSIAHYPFSLFIFHSNCMEDGEEKGKYAQDIADRIISCLAPQPSAVGFDIEGLTARESEPEGGGHRISRVIVEGQINIKRID